MKGWVAAVWIGTLVGLAGFWIGLTYAAYVLLVR
jgi:uncharacterized membrane protein YqaE (UPF0057 family)